MERKTDDLIASCCCGCQKTHLRYQRSPHGVRSRYRSPVDCQRAGQSGRKSRRRSVPFTDQATMGSPVKSLPADVRIVEVGPRDGLQNQPKILSTDKKLEFIRLLADAGLQDIEATSFVHPKWIPQLADADDLVPQLPKRSGTRYSALVPNLKGLERALQTGVSRIAVFTAASETFNKKNINMTIA